MVDASCHHHVEPIRQQLGDHPLRAWRIIGRITVDQNVDVGFDVVKHAPDHVALALMALAAHHRACGLGNSDSIVT